MYRWLFKTISFLLAVTWLATNLLTPVAVLAQTGTPSPGGRPGTEGVAGVSLGPADLEAAINSPTPNLANTTAYVLYTIIYIFTRGVNPDVMNYTDDDFSNPNTTAPGASIMGQPTAYSAYQRPDSLGEAINGSGLIGGVGHLITQLIANQPASSSEYVAYIAGQSRLMPQTAYAQGFGVGFNALSPILVTWAAFRDVAYFLIVLMFLIVGLLIIFRKKVSGNVAVTVQNALPRLIITLILITFSYAIAGFMVDLMFWAIYFVVLIFRDFFEGGTVQFALPAMKDESRSVHDLALNTNLFKFLFLFFLGGGGRSAAEAIANMIAGAIETLPVIGEIHKTLSAVDIFGIAAKSVTLLFQLIFGIAILIQAGRVFFQLLMSYAGFVINVVLSPFILLPGVMPGKDPFMKWVKNLVAGLAPFVVVIFMLFMALVLTGVGTKSGIGYGSGAENDTSGLQLPLVRGGLDVAGEMMGLLAIGFVMLLPEAVGMTKKALGATGGPMDDLKDKAFSNIKKGWDGNKYIPGAKKLAGPSAGAAIALGTGAVVGGAALGARGGKAAAAEAGLGQRGQKIAQIGGALIGGAGGVLLSPTATTIGAVGGAGGAAAYDYYGRGRGMWEKWKKSDSAVTRGAVGAAGFVGSEARRAIQDRNVATPPTAAPTTPGSSRVPNPPPGSHYTAGNSPVIEGE